MSSDAVCKCCNGAGTQTNHEGLKVLCHCCGGRGWSLMT